ncbi:hypothetical protein FE257_007108 [Aspergillus nanangensis]|uniref:P-loop containing nucleoside triphosphate hydrolase protein n=1 Tax=Aspergillus nanangensis TaxID=2582783 RepID=A0AAD4GUF3_ASPNN|nr:hypothetical protein FE257_007108 [Aspergillus nanangensis]
MSREIDRLAQPVDKKKMRVIIPSCSRTGTMGLYFAMQILGYRAYHMYEMMQSGGLLHMKIIAEAIIANRNRLSGIKRYEREDVDKWMANYDVSATHDRWTSQTVDNTQRHKCFIEVMTYIGPRALEGYAADPDVKFILTERDPDAWVKSFNKTAGQNVTMATTFPLNVLKHFNTNLGCFFHLNQLAYWSMSDKTMPGDPDNEATLRKNYVEYIRSVKEILPKDRSLFIKLEEGLGWEQICPFLDVPIPDQEYPRGNEPEKFEKVAKFFLEPWMRDAAFKVGAVVVSAIGTAGYLGWKYYNFQR